MKNPLKSLLVAVRPFNRQFNLATVCETIPLFQLSGACIFIIKLLLLLSTSCSLLASVFCMHCDIIETLKVVIEYRKNIINNPEDLVLRLGINIAHVTLLIHIMFQLRNLFHAIYLNIVTTSY